MVFVIILLVVLCPLNNGMKRAIVCFDFPVDVCVVVVVVGVVGVVVVVVVVTAAVVC